LLNRLIIFSVKLKKNLANKILNVDEKQHLIICLIEFRLQFLHPIAPIEIAAVINSMSNNKFFEHDEILIVFIKQVTQVLVPILAFLVNSSFQLGSFPQSLKIAKVVLIPKTCEKTLLKISLPISLLTSFFKNLSSTVSL